MSDVVVEDVEPVVVEVDDVVEVDVVVGVETVARPMTTPAPAMRSAPAVKMSAFGKFFVMLYRFCGRVPTVCLGRQSVFSSPLAAYGGRERKRGCHEGCGVLRNWWTRGFSL